MRFQIIFFTTILIFTFFLTGCPNSETPNTNTVNTPNSNANAPTTNVNSPFITNKKEVAPTTNNAPTITPVVNGYYDALKKKDDAAIRKVMSLEFIKLMEADMKADKKTSLAAFMAETEDLVKPVEVRNEKIEGDMAIAEVKGGIYVNWTPFEFTKENGLWKYTGKSPDTKKVMESTANSNAAK